MAPSVALTPSAAKVVESSSPQPQDDDESCSSSSVDTEDAFLDMLGLKKKETSCSSTAPLASILVMDDEEEKEAVNPKRVTQLTLPPKCARYGGNRATAVTMDQFCSYEECQAILALAGRTGFAYVTEASHVAPDGSTHKVQLQTPNPHKLAVLEHEETLDRLWKRLQSVLLLREETRLQNWWNEWQTRTTHCCCGPPLGLNPRLRVLQYDSNDNDRFEPHFDATTRVGDHATSQITVLLYLNDGNGKDFEGGETRFLNSHISQCNCNNHPSSQTHDQDTVKVVPQTGKLVLFEHDLYHSGAPLSWGTKHVLRTDILFPEKGEEKEEEDATVVENAKDDDSHNSPPPLLLVSDLCARHHWSVDQQTLLDEMGLLHITLESFLAPGTVWLTHLLLEAGIPAPQMETFLKDAHQERVKANNHK